MGWIRGLGEYAWAGTAVPSRAPVARPDTRVSPATAPAALRDPCVLFMSSPVFSLSAVVPLCRCHDGQGRRPGGTCTVIGTACGAAHAPAPAPLHRLPPPVTTASDSPAPP